jgi:hypothetical protein
MDIASHSSSSYDECLDFLEIFGSDDGSWSAADSHESEERKLEHGTDSCVDVVSSTNSDRCKTYVIGCYQVHRQSEGKYQKQQQ